MGDDRGGEEVENSGGGRGDPLGEDAENKGGWSGDGPFDLLVFWVPLPPPPPTLRSLFPQPG